MRCGAEAEGQKFQQDECGNHEETQDEGGTRCAGEPATPEGACHGSPCHLRRREVAAKQEQPGWQEQQEGGEPQAGFAVRQELLQDGCQGQPLDGSENGFGKGKRRLCEDLPFGANSE